MASIYNPVKLSEWRPIFREKHVLIIGAGAVGAALMEFLVKMGTSVDALDFDSFTLENAAKHSCLVRTPEDVGRNKAECVSARVQPLLEEGCTSNGINGNVCMLGPEAFADYDVVVLSVDNYDAKILTNELIRQLPEERRPILIMDGTYDEMAQSVILDGKDFCIRCLIDEAWMPDSSIRTSCSGPQIRELDGEPEIVRTSNLASSMAAHLSAEQFRTYAIGSKAVTNHRLTYTAYPNLELSVSSPKRKRNCPGCAIQPPAKIEWLHGSTLTTTLRQALDQIAERLQTTDFEVYTHWLDFRRIRYTEFIIDDVCHSCGRPISVMKHGGRTFPEDLLCETCRAAGKHGRQDESFGAGRCVTAFSANSEENLMEMTLFDLGYPLGAHIRVVQRNGGIDILDSDKIVETVFAFDDDHSQMHRIHKL